jgi:hypothetical protein
MGLVRVRPAEALRPRGRGRPWSLTPGPFPPQRASAALDRRLEHGVSRGNGRPPFWERPSRALPDPEDFSHASNAIRPPRAAVVNKTHQRTPLSQRGASRCLEVLRAAKAAV